MPAIDSKRFRDPLGRTLSFSPKICWRPEIALSLLFFTLSGPALGQDGKLVDSTIVAVSEEQIESLAEAGTPVAGIELRRITYLSEGLKVRGYLAMPKGEEKLPCVIFNRGGNREFGALDDARAVRILGPLAARGYVAVAGQYRGNGGGEGLEEFGGADVNDVLNLLPLLDSLPRADASRVGMFGWSRGGMMTYLALARTDRIKAAIVGAGPVDAFDGVRRRPEMEARVYAELVPNFDSEREAALEARSAIRWVDKLSKTTPILLLHGSSDWRVHPTEALRMAAALYEAKHPFRFVFFEGGDHGLTEHRAERTRLVNDWLDTYVRDGKEWPSLEPHGR